MAPWPLSASPPALGAGSPRGRGLAPALSPDIFTVCRRGPFRRGCGLESELPVAAHCPASPAPAGQSHPQLNAIRPRGQVGFFLESARRDVGHEPEPRLEQRAGRAQGPVRGGGACKWLKRRIVNAQETVPCSTGAISSNTLRRPRSDVSGRPTTLCAREPSPSWRTRGATQTRQGAPESPPPEGRGFPRRVRRHPQGLDI